MFHVPGNVPQRWPKGQWIFVSKVFEFRSLYQSAFSDPVFQPFYFQSIFSFRFYFLRIKSHFIILFQIWRYLLQHVSSWRCWWIRLLVPGLTTSLTIQGHMVNMESGAQDDFQALTCQMTSKVGFWLFYAFSIIWWLEETRFFNPICTRFTTWYEERSRGDDATGGTVNTTSLFGGNGVW